MASDATNEDAMYKHFNEDLLRCWVMGGATVFSVTLGTVLIVAMKLQGV